MLRYSLHLKKCLYFKVFPLFWEFQPYWDQLFQQGFNSTLFCAEDRNLFSTKSRTAVEQRVTLREYYSECLFLTINLTLMKPCIVL